MNKLIYLISLKFF